jgi:hypothetical protein
MTILFSSLAPVNANPLFGCGILPAARPEKKATANKPAPKPATPGNGFYDRTNGVYIPSVDEDRWLSQDNARREAENRRMEWAACESAAVDAMSLGLIPRDLAEQLARTSLVGHYA